MGEGLWDNHKSDCCNALIFAGTSVCSKCGNLTEAKQIVYVKKPSMWSKVWNKITVG